MLLCSPPAQNDPEIAAQHQTPEARDLPSDFAERSRALHAWDIASLSALIQLTLARHSIKMPKLGIPLRLAVTGRKQTPAIDAVLALLGRDTVLKRLAAMQSQAG